jgi:hypothetical protein
MSEQRSGLVPPTEGERARTAAFLGAILGMILVALARRRRR